MKLEFNKIRIVILVAACFACFVILFPHENYVQLEPQEICNLPPIDDFNRENHPKIESVLYRLMTIYFTKGIKEAKNFAKVRGIDMFEDSVRVVAEAKFSRDKILQMKKESGEATYIYEAERRAYLVTRQIEALGGKVDTTYLHLVQSVVPLFALQNLADFPIIEYLRLPKKPIPLVTSEGVEKTGANQWHSITPYRTEEEVKVCILDVGFKGYENLLGSELPTTVETKSFRADGKLNPDKHGTACAEIVHDMAPNAKLFLVNFNTDVEHHNAVDWIINQGIDIVSYSIGWTNFGAGDGTGPICEDVKKAHENGIIWVSAAGNEADTHWEGNFKDWDKDNWHNFSGQDETLSFYVKAYTPVSVSLNWNDWGSWNGSRYSGSNQDYDLYLFSWTGTNWINVDKSSNSQTGTQWPVEQINGWSSKDSTMGIAIKKINANQNVKHEVFIEGNYGPIEYNRPRGSLSIPADSHYAIAVGATDCLDDSYHSYSSRGPTSDLRIKPDFCAPSGVSSHTYGNLDFFGTSAATPHVAGAFALIKGKSPFSLDQIKAILEARALDFDPPGRDNKFGLGRLNLIK